MAHLIAPVQGIYFFVFGTWPILHMNSFLRGTGPKQLCGSSKPLAFSWQSLVMYPSLLMTRQRQGLSIVFLAIGSVLSLVVFHAFLL